MAAEVGTEAGPGATTKEFNRALIETFRANRGVVPGELQGANFLLLGRDGQPRLAMVDGGRHTIRTEIRTVFGMGGKRDRRR
jgi:hypothetical protein